MVMPAKVSVKNCLHRYLGIQRKRKVIGLPKKIRLALYGEEKFMASFSGYLRGKKRDMLELRLFTGMEALEKATAQGKIDVLFAEGLNVQNLDTMSASISQIFLLTEEEQETVQEGSVQKIFKYQPAKDMMGILLSALAENDRISCLPVSLGQRRGELIALYSPFGGGGVTSYAVSMAKESAKSLRTLYVNLEQFHSLIRAQGRKRMVDSVCSPGMSEVIFYLRQKKEKLALKLETLVYPWEGVDILPGVGDYRDLFSITREDIQGLIEILLVQTEYEKIFFDIGMLQESMMYLMEQCSRLYMPKPAGEMQECKVKAFRELLQKEGKDRLLGQIFYVDMKV